jgi:hypothetical protein
MRTARTLLLRGQMRSTGRKRILSKKMRMRKQD